MITEKIDIRVDGSLENAAFYTYIIEHSEEISIDKRPFIIVCPGGGYEWLSDREAEMIALTFNSYGYHAGVLRYSIKPAVFPTACLELGNTIKYLRKKADKWHIDKNRIIIAGFSAGGHLAASYGALWNKDIIKKALDGNEKTLKPNGLILSYPVITSGKYAHRESIDNLLGKKKDDKELLKLVSVEKQVTEDMPKAFIWHTYDDGLVPCMNSILLTKAMLKKGISAELHIFEKGGHGLSLANKLTRDAGGGALEPGCECWTELAHSFIERL